MPVWGFFIFGVYETCTLYARYLPLGFIAGGLIFLYHLSMETLLKTLAEIGIDHATIDAIRSADEAQARENALLLLMDDDRHEYVD